MMNNIESKRERSREKKRHRFNVVRQFAYVHRNAAIILIINPDVHQRYIYIYIGKPSKTYTYGLHTDLYGFKYGAVRIPYGISKIPPYSRFVNSLSRHSLRSRLLGPSTNVNISH
jgi:hypothetical protein